ncbi:glycosyltransferase [Belliella sp. R4-6]|uniref:Glycosyltransferase n=1 Tax=Belliella alkalica TaxID=1730871 RepID=A0ABS9V6R1_9BACT|nr:glycosyltransferase [Belliella alkalica]MCH7412063.1 glycosyltransferase [Belliella alkalica]
MNILFVIEQDFEFNTGGVQIVTERLINLFHKMEHNLVLVSLSSTDLDLSLDFHNDFKIPYYKISKGNEFLKLQKLILKYQINLFINQVGYDPNVSKLLFKVSRNKAKIINCLHINPLNFYDNHEFLTSKFLNDNGLKAFDNKLVHKFILYYHVVKQRKELGYIVKNTNAFVMLSERFKEELYQLVPDVKKFDHKIYGINNPFEVPDLDISTIKKKNVILYVGRLEISQKRVDLLLEIWDKLHRVLPDWQFWVVGHGSEEENMKNFCLKHQMNRVKFFGKQNPDEYYKQAKIFHLTSAFEGFGNVLVEAQSFGCVPVMFNSYSAAQDIVLNQETGILIEPFNIDVYVQETLDLIADKDRLKRYVENAIIHSHNYSYSVTYEKWVNVFSQLN